MSQLNGYSLESIKSLHEKFNYFFTKKDFPMYPLLDKKMPILNKDGYFYHIPEMDRRVILNLIFHLDKVVFITQEDFIFLKDILNCIDFIFDDEVKRKHILDICDQIRKDVSTLLEILSKKP